MQKHLKYQRCNSCDTGAYKTDVIYEIFINFSSALVFFKKYVYSRVFISSAGANIVYTSLKNENFNCGFAARLTSSSR